MSFIILQIFNHEILCTSFPATAWKLPVAKKHSATVTEKAQDLIEGRRS